MMDKPDTQTRELKGLAEELRILRAELQGVRDSFHQLATKVPYAAPEFIYAPPEPGLASSILPYIESLAEFGPDVIQRLRDERRFADSFLMQALEGNGNDSEFDLAKLRSAIQCEQNHSNLQRNLFALHDSAFQQTYGEEISKLRHCFGDAELAVLHLSCRARAYLAHESASTFVGPGSSIANIIVVGHTYAERGKFTFDAPSRILVVPADDSYDGLATKTALAYHFLAQCNVGCPVMKVDDDMRCRQPDLLLRQLAPLARSHHYMGRVWHAKLGFSRTWHFGKCADPALNDRPYGLLPNASYAEGPCYILSPRALNVLAKASVFAERLFQTEFSYEDLAVGKVLNHYGIFPLNYDFIAQGVLASTDAWMMERAGRPAG